jgi:hypothetical protein
MDIVGSTFAAVILIRQIDFSLFLDHDPVFGKSEIRFP